VQALQDAPLGQIANTAYVYGAEMDPDNSNNHVTMYTKIEANPASTMDENSTEVNSTEV